MALQDPGQGADGGGRGAAARPVDPATVTAADLPVLVKAAAGGGGRGMRVVRELGRAGRASWRRPAPRRRAAFGDGEVFVEPYVEGGRHVEVQILADAHGTVWALGDPRLLPPAPPPEGHRGGPGARPAPTSCAAALHDAAVGAPRGPSATGARAPSSSWSRRDGRPYFLEMNTRLQVEHPVTEAVFGLDLVALQCASPRARPLPARPPARARPRRRGPPVRGGPGARLAAADRAPLHRLGRAAGRRRPPRHRATPAATPIGVHYDPMLAKVIAQAPTRAEAVRRLAGALERARIHGPVTNRDLLVRSLRHPEFAGGPARHRLLRPPPRRPHRRPAPGPGAAALAAALADAAPRPGAPLAARFGGWRNVPSQPQTKRYRSEPDGTEHEVRYRPPATASTAEAPGVRVARRRPRTASSSKSTACGGTFDVDALRRPGPRGHRRRLARPHRPAPLHRPRRPQPSPAPCSPPCPAPSSASPRARRRATGSRRGSRCCGWRR